MRKFTALAGAVALVAAGLVLNGALAADPANGTLNSANREATWTGSPAGPTAAESLEASDPDDPCADVACDEYTLAVDPAGITGPVLDIVLSTADPVDYDLYVYDRTGAQIGSSALSFDTEAVRVPNPTAGPYLVRVNPWGATQANSYDAKATLRSSSDLPPANPDTPTQTLWLQSANGGYSQDLAIDPAATAARRAPAGSQLTAARPGGSTTATAAVQGGPKSPGAPGNPTFSVPAAATVSALCLDLWVADSGVFVSTGVFSSFYDTAGTEHAVENAEMAPGTAVHRVRAEVAIEDAPLSVESAWSYVFSTFFNAPFTLHYGSAAQSSSITLNPVPGTCAGIGDTSVAAPSTTASPEYTTYVSPAGLADTYGEPTVGNNHSTGVTMFQQGLDTAAVVFDDSTTPPGATWEDRSAPQTSVQTLDPIVEVEPDTGRTFVSQLVGACSLGAVSSDDGETWESSTGCPEPHGADHQSIGSGPYSPARPRTVLDAFDKVFYYCSQSVVAAFCGRSTDGGRSFQNSVPIYAADACRGLHGHVKVSPLDGTVYVPNSACGGKAAVAVSEDGGQTYDLRQVDVGGGASGDSDAAVAIGADGTVYLEWIGDTGQPMVATSTDRGVTWSRPLDVGAVAGVDSSMFPVIVAGDGDRAAATFLGAAKGGDFAAEDWGVDTKGNTDAADDEYTPDATWYLYVAHTYDGGATWTTSRVTDDPVQRGCLTTGTGSPCRNLLDFNGISKDAQGRALVAWADGCLGDCATSRLVSKNSRTAEGTLSRLTTGLGLYEAFDGEIRSGSGTPVDPCEGVTEVTDPSGDSTVFAPAGTPPVPSPETDITRVGVTASGSTVRFAVSVVDLKTAPSGAGDAVRSFFGVNGQPFTLDMNRMVAGTGTTTSGTLSKPDPADDTGLTPVTVATGFPVVFDVDKEVAYADLPADKLGTDVGVGDSFSGIEVLWRRSLRTVALAADSANGTCPTPIRSAAAVNDPSSTTTTTTSSTSTPPTTSSTSTPSSTSTTTTTAAPGGSSDRAGGSGGASTAAPPSGYWMVTDAGEVFAFGDVRHHGNAPVGRNKAVDIEGTPSGAGYWIVDDKGRVFGSGDADHFGNAPALGSLETVTALSGTRTGRGYWIFTNLGRVFALGDAVNYGDMSGTALNGPVLDSIPTPSGRGYYMVASDGGIFTFGDADFRGSMGDTPLNKPVQSLVPDPDGDGYWLVASDGGIFSFAATFHGSMGDVKLNGPITGMVGDLDGYLMVGEDGGIFTFGRAQFHGSLGDRPPARPVTSVDSI